MNWDIGNTLMVNIKGVRQPKKIVGIQFKHGFACYKLDGNMVGITIQT